MEMLLALLSCALPSPEARARDAVLRALQDDAAPVAERLDWCAEVEDADLQGNCMLGVLSSRVEAAPADGDVWCPQLPDGPWRWECRFVQAEAWLHADDPDAAAAACGAAGDFAAPCGQHLYQAPVRATVGAAGVDGWVESLPATQALESTWQARLGPEIPVHPGVWSVFYQISFQRSPHALRTACDTVPEPDRALCRQLWDEVRAVGTPRAGAPVSR
ncbi:MAG: hypothetical protein H6742_20845 [Alphaproteobacteria bacterium]|nr:hypothetical protein [Alphaproteobacteria bacterium]